MANRTERDCLIKIDQSTPVYVKERKETLDCSSAAKVDIAGGTCLSLTSVGSLAISTTVWVLSSNPTVGAVCGVINIISAVSLCCGATCLGWGMINKKD